MRNAIVLGCSGIAALFAASIAVIAVVTAPPPRSPLPRSAFAEAAAPTEGPGPAGAATSSEVPVPRPASSAPGQPREILPPASVPTPQPLPRPAWLVGSTPALAPRRDPTPLGPLRPYVAAGMAGLQAAVAGCASEEPPADALPDVHPGKTTLTLHIEALDNKLRITDAVAPDEEVAGDWRVRCAQRQLRGKVFYAPSRAGPRFEIPFVLDL